MKTNNQKINHKIFIPAESILRFVTQKTKTPTKKKIILKNKKNSNSK